MLRYVLVVALVVSGFYIGATQLVLYELNNVRSIYANADDIAQSAVAVQSPRVGR